MFELKRRYIYSNKTEETPSSANNNKKRENHSDGICYLKSCNEPACACDCVSEKGGNKIEHCLKHHNLFTEKKFRLIAQQNKNKKCKNCGQKIERNRNKAYCSVTCRQQASRKIKDISIEKLVKSLEWQKVERLIKNSPLGLNSINYSENFEDLYILFVLCHFEIKNKYDHNDFTFYHIIPLRFGGKNTLDNIIIAPRFISRSMNLSLIGTSDFIKNNKPLYIQNNIIETCLKKKNLKDKMLELINKINLTFDFNEKVNLMEREYDSIKNEREIIKSIKYLFSYRIITYRSSHLLRHLEIQLPNLANTTAIANILDMIEFYNNYDLHNDTKTKAQYIKDFSDLFAIYSYILILNCDAKYLSALKTIKNELIEFKKDDVHIASCLDKINQKLLKLMTPKFNLKSVLNFEKHRTHYLERYHEKYKTD